MSKGISTVLIANRGEIVCRIVASCRAMNIRTVTIFAEDDQSLPHARIGDINCQLEGSSLSETYLNGDQIIQIAKDMEVDAIHPGYGFLSENAEFAAEVTKAGLIFVGPTADIIARMGDKAASRQLCEEMGVPVIPGYHGDNQDDTYLAKQAELIGFPVLIKAAAGGGGKGMRIVERKDDVLSGLESARSEAKNAFGNGHLLMEKYLQQPRHIEVQVLSDGQGHHVHLFERECSIQRRHQKIVEESPAVNLPEKTRHALYEAAIKITSHIHYVGVGTMEFILDSSGAFYFLEMNTRLQVEHPVTEMITGLDLVQCQLEVASGKPLSVLQENITQIGHAIEVRLYAEDPAREFLPAPGELEHFSLPHRPYIRCENGYCSGVKVSSHYDPMLAKIVAYGATRDQAINRLLEALEHTQIGGVTTNRTFLMQVLDHDAFRKGNINTDFIELYKDTLLDNALSDDELARIIASYLLFGKQRSYGGVPVSGSEQSAWTNTTLAGFK